ncbi:EAL and HDOD domain-containing protein [Larsenimonas salina]|uniref:EAL and HDOD domain-containing protein n=1 Tax=Larsenimonas salina TaxID=1295565 RepID=UPI002072FC85|nr:HDOD domain-containing protein [Larsenimonas salina]MCM5705031.1 HDOD domain-containing protein [Larsenimonas salina]
MLASTPPGSPSSNILYARQPIFDREGLLHGFEFLFRYADGQSLACGTDAHQATCTVLLNAFLDTSIEHACDGTRAYINFTEETLKSELPFDTRHLVIEVLEGIPQTEVMVERLKYYKGLGHTLALDDYALKDANHAFVPLVDIIKVDFPAYDDDMALLRVVTALKRRNPRAKLLAEKVETQKDFELCRLAGFDLFQGYFLARPTLIEGRHRLVQGTAASSLELLALFQESDVHATEVARIIQQDPVLSVRLLKLVNSAHHQRSTEIASIKQAIILLGLERIRQLACLMALAQLNVSSALPKLALTRAFFCQSLAAAHFAESISDSAFTVGLFSYLDAFFKTPLTHILDALPLHSDITRALTHHEGTLGLLLETTRYYENGQWSSIRWTTLLDHGITPDLIHSAYMQALESAKVPLL